MRFVFTFIFLLVLTSCDYSSNEVSFKNFKKSLTEDILFNSLDVKNYTPVFYSHSIHNFKGTACDYIESLDSATNDENLNNNFSIFVPPISKQKSCHIGSFDLQNNAYFKNVLAKYLSQIDKVSFIEFVSSSIKQMEDDWEQQDCEGDWTITYQTLKYLYKNIDLIDSVDIDDFVERNVIEKIYKYYVQYNFPGFLNNLGVFESTDMFKVMQSRFYQKRKEKKFDLHEISLFQKKVPLFAAKSYQELMREIETVTDLIVKTAKNESQKEWFCKQWLYERLRSQELSLSGYDSVSLDNEGYIEPNTFIEDDKVHFVDTIPDYGVFIKSISRTPVILEKFLTENTPYNSSEERLELDLDRFKSENQFESQVNMMRIWWSYLILNNETKMDFTNVNSSLSPFLLAEKNWSKNSQKRYLKTIKIFIDNIYNFYRFQLPENKGRLLGEKKINNDIIIKARPIIDLGLVTYSMLTTLKNSTLDLSEDWRVKIKNLLFSVILTLKKLQFNNTCFSEINFESNTQRIVPLYKCDVLVAKEIKHLEKLLNSLEFH